MTNGELNRVVSALVRAGKKRFDGQTPSREEVDDFFTVVIAINLPSATNKEAIRDAAACRFLGARCVS